MAGLAIVCDASDFASSSLAVVEAHWLSANDQDASIIASPARRIAKNSFLIKSSPQKGFSIFFPFQIKLKTNSMMS